MRQQVTIAHGRDGWSLLIRDCPLYKEFAGRAWLRLCDLSRGWLGGHGCPEFMWKIPLGRPRWDTDTFDNEPLLINSLAGKLHNLCSAVIFWADGENLVWISIDRDTAFKLAPDFVKEVEELGSDSSTWTEGRDAATWTASEDSG